MKLPFCHVPFGKHNLAAAWLRLSSRDRCVFSFSPAQRLLLCIHHSFFSISHTNAPWSHAHSWLLTEHTWFCLHDCVAGMSTVLPPSFQPSRFLFRTPVPMIFSSQCLFLFFPLFSFFWGSMCCLKLLGLLKQNATDWWSYKTWKFSSNSSDIENPKSRCQGDCGSDGACFFIDIQLSLSVTDGLFGLFYKNGEGFTLIPNSTSYSTGGGDFSIRTGENVSTQMILGDG